MRINSNNRSCKDSKVRDRINELGLSTAEVARRINTPITQVYSLANGQVVPGLLMAKRVATALECQPSDLFDCYSVDALMMTKDDLQQFIGGSK